LTKVQEKWYYEYITQNFINTIHQRTLSRQAARCLFYIRQL